MTNRFPPPIFIFIFAISISIYILSFKYKDNISEHAINLNAQLTNYIGKGAQGCDSLDFVFPKQAVESNSPLPEKVKEAFRSTVSITVRAVSNGRDPHNPDEVFVSYGSGFFVNSLYLSARHVFLRTMLDLKHYYPIQIDKNGLPVSAFYNYEFCGTADIDGKPVSFPLKLVAMGDPYLPQDYAAFKAEDSSPKLKPLEFEENLNLNDVVYSGGRVPSFNPSNMDIGPIRKRVLIDFLNNISTGQVNAILDDTPLNKYALIEKMYRIIRFPGNIEPGYSGGPVFDKNGKVIGMSIFLSQGNNFSHAISAKDLKVFVNNIKK